MKKYFVHPYECISKACKFIKKETLARVFSCEFYDIFENTFFNRPALVTAFVT